MAAAQGALPPLLVLAVVVLLLGGAHAAPLRNKDGSCVMFPPGSTWHQDISTWPVYSGSRCGELGSAGPG